MLNFQCTFPLHRIRQQRSDTQLKRSCNGNCCNRGHHRNPPQDRRVRFRNSCSQWKLCIETKCHYKQIRSKCWGRSRIACPKAEMSQKGSDCSHHRIVLPCRKRHKQHGKQRWTLRQKDTRHLNQCIFQPNRTRHTFLGTRSCLI